MYICIYVFVCICLYLCVCVYTYVYIYMCVHIHLSIYLHRYLCISIYLYLGLILTHATTGLRSNEPYSRRMMEGDSISLLNCFIRYMGPLLLLYSAEIQQRVGLFARAPVLGPYFFVYAAHFLTKLPPLVDRPTLERAAFAPSDRECLYLRVSPFLTAVYGSSLTYIFC